jgi:hypothetical protein
MNQTSVTERPRQRARSEGHPTCACGQELDICTHAHCPRCGHRVAMRLVARAYGRS